MSYRNCKSDVAHPLTTHFLLGNFDITSIADDTAITNAFIFTTIALIVLSRTEDLFAEKTIFLRLVGPIVNRFRFEDLSARPLCNILRRSQRDADCLEIAFYLCFFIIESRHISI